MAFTYICDKCEQIYVSSTEYSRLKDKVCCQFPLWYTPKQVQYLKQNRPTQLLDDYLLYVLDCKEVLKDDL